jgi:hypothetical protein
MSEVIDPSEWRPSSGGRRLALRRISRSAPDVATSVMKVAASKLRSASSTIPGRNRSVSWAA